MGLLSLLKKLDTQKNKIRILVLGLENSGKTSLVSTFINLFQDHQDTEVVTTPTNGVEIQEMNFKNFQICFWDVGGSSSNRPYWHNYFDSVSIIMWVIDSSDIDKFEETKNELETILTNDKLNRASLIVVANKQDLSNAAPFPDFIRDMEINTNNRKWTAFAAANKGDKKNIFRNELEICLEWIIEDFSSKMSTSH